MKAELIYFKDTGKYYSDGEYETTATEFYAAVKEIKDMLKAGKNPGLNDFAVMRNKFDTLVNISDTVKVGTFFDTTKDAPIERTYTLPHLIKFENL